MKKLKLPFLSERYIGFTIPKAGTFHICDHDEVWRIAIGSDDPAVEVTDLQPYKFVEDRADFLGLVFEGLAENQPLLRVGPNEIVYHFDPNKSFVAVRYVVAGQSAEIQFPIRRLHPPLTGAFERSGRGSREVKALEREAGALLRVNRTEGAPCDEAPGIRRDYGGMTVTMCSRVHSDGGSSVARRTCELRSTISTSSVSMPISRK
jgi:hypothetical protein